MGQRRLDRSRAIRSEEEIRRTKAKESETQELGEESLILETSGTEEKAVEGLKTALEIEAEEEGKDESKGGGRVCSDSKVTDRPRVTHSGCRAKRDNAH